MININVQYWDSLNCVQINVSVPIILLIGILCSCTLRYTGWPISARNFNRSEMGNLNVDVFKWLTLYSLFTINFSVKYYDSFQSFFFYSAMMSIYCKNVKKYWYINSNRVNWNIWGEEKFIFMYRDNNLLIFKYLILRFFESDHPVYYFTICYFYIVCALKMIVFYKFKFYLIT